MKETTSLELECKHCHLPVVEKTIGEDGNIYCCYGCKVVDELLIGEKSILDSQRLNVKKYSWLEEKSIRKSLISFEEGNYVSISLHLPAIHCSSCIYLLESLPELEHGINSVHVHFSRKKADISFKEDRLKLSHLAAILEFIGYAPDFQTVVKSSKKKNNLLIKLGIAGFFFGNTMLLALPEYLHSFKTDIHLQIFFRYLMMGFSIPVVFYSGKDYFVSAYKSLRAGFLNIDLPIALGVGVLFIRSVYEVFSGYGPGYFDSLCGLIFFLLIGKWYQQKTYENFTFDRDFRSFIPLAANLLNDDGKEQPVSVNDLKKGDKIVLREGEVLPADAILISDRAEIDYSYITGEAIPVAKTIKQEVYAGARLSRGMVTFEIRCGVDHSYLSTLWTNTAKESNVKSTLNLTDKLSGYFTPVLILIAVISAAAWAFYDAGKAITVFTAVLIVACPCALALAEPFAGGSAMRWLGRFGFYLKNVQVLNNLAEIDYMVFDKTGTLTRLDNIKVDWNGENLSLMDITALSIIVEKSRHPLAKPLLEFLAINDKETKRFIDFKEVNGEGVSAFIDEDFFELGKASFLDVKEISAATSVYLKKNGNLKGYFSFYQQTRNETANVLKKLSDHYPLALLSGDNDSEERRFEEMLGTKADLKFNQSPHQKKEYIDELQHKSNNVLMIGDGLNDAGALQRSNVGISICEKNVNYFPASDALLLADSFVKMPEMMQYARLNRKVVYQAFTFSLIYNIAGLSFAVAGILSPLVCAVLMPLSSVSIVIFTTFRNRRLAKRLFLRT